MTKLYTQSEILGKAHLPHAWFVAACAETGIRPTRIGPSLCYPHDALVLAMNRRRFLDSPEGKQRQVEARRANCAVARAKLREMVRRMHTTATGSYRGGLTRWNNTRTGELPPDSAPKP